MNFSAKLEVVLGSPLITEAHGHLIDIDLYDDVVTAIRRLAYHDAGTTWTTRLGMYRAVTTAGIEFEFECYVEMRLVTDDDDTWAHRSGQHQNIKLKYDGTAYIGSKVIVIKALAVAGSDLNKAGVIKKIAPTIDHEIGHLARTINTQQLQGIFRHRSKRTSEIGYAFDLPDELDANVHAIIAHYDSLGRAEQAAISYEDLVAQVVPDGEKRFRSSKRTRQQIIRRLWSSGVKLNRVFSNQ